MSRKSLSLVLVLVFLLLFSVVNGVLIHRRLTAPRTASPAAIQRAKREAERASILRAWQKQRPVALRSSSLADQLASLVEDGRIPPWPSAEKVPQKSLSAGQRQDLHQAVAGLLRVYADNSPRAMVEYMRSRQMRLAPERRRLMEARLQKNGAAADELAGLSDEALYQRDWSISNIQCRQMAVLPTVSRLSIWKWKGTDPKPMLDVAAMARLWDCPDLWPGYMSLVCNFEPVPPHTLATQLKATREALVADVQLILGHDQELLFCKAPYLVRFWYQ